jgi:hypothetical protein
MQQLKEQDLVGETEVLRENLPQCPGTLSIRNAADYPPPSSADKNVWSYISIPSHAYMVWYLSKHNSNFTLAVDTML